MTSVSRSQQLVSLGIALVMASACGSTVATTSGPHSSTTGLAPTDGTGLTDPAVPGSPVDMTGTSGLPGAPTTAGGVAPAPGSSAAALSDATGVPVGSSPRTGAPNSPPIRVGFLALDFGNLGKSMGFESSYDPHRGFKDLVASLNTTGGLGGRLIKPDYYSIDPTTSGTGDQAAQTACTYFTQDKRDELVVSADFYSETLEACLSAARVPHFDAGYSYAPERAAQHRFPYYFAPVSMGVDRYSAAELDVAVASGLVKRGEKLGFLVEACPQHLRAFRDVVVPAARRHGLQLVSAEHVCVNGAQDLGSEISQIQSAVVKFKSEGVTTVSAVSQAEAIVAVYFSQNAENQKWRPNYLLTSVASPDRLVKSQGNSLSVPREQLPGLRGVGWMPIADVGVEAASAHPEQSARRASCLARSKTAGDSNNQNDGGLRSQGLAYYLIACDTLLLLDRTLALSGGRTDLNALDSVYAKAVDGFSSASNVDGSLQHIDGRHDGIAGARPWAFDRGCSCIRYVGPASALR